MGYDPWIIQRDGISPDHNGCFVNILSSLTLAEIKTGGSNRHAARNQELPPTQPGMAGFRKEWTQSLSHNYSTGAPVRGRPSFPDSAIGHRQSVLQRRSEDWKPEMPVVGLREEPRPRSNSDLPDEMRALAAASAVRQALPRGL